MGDFIHVVIQMTTPVLFAALGGLFTELSGLLNIGLEGMMLSSAFFSVFISETTGSLFLGIAAGIGISIMLALLMGFLSLNLKGNVFVVGLATNLFANGLTVLLQSLLLHSKGTVFFTKAPRVEPLSIPFLNDIPFFGKLVSGYHMLDYLALFSVFVCAVIIFRTPYGYHLRAVGKDSEAAESVGISVYKHRMMAFIASGLFAGLGGCALSLPLQTFVGGMSNGRGWIALVAVILGRGNPFGVLVGAIVFGAASAVSNLLQAGTQISPKLLMSLPFIITLLMMVFYRKEKPGEEI
jgi:simple sugar transport system permease protein